MDAAGVMRAQSARRGKLVPLSVISGSENGARLLFLTRTCAVPAIEKELQTPALLARLVLVAQTMDVRRLLPAGEVIHAGAFLALSAAEQRDYVERVCASLRSTFLASTLREHRDAIFEALGYPADARASLGQDEDIMDLLVDRTAVRADQGLMVPRSVLDVVDARAAQAVTRSQTLASKQRDLSFEEAEILAKAIDRAADLAEDALDMAAARGEAGFTVVEPTYPLTVNGIPCVSDCTRGLGGCWCWTGQGHWDRCARGAC